MFESRRFGGLLDLRIITRFGLGRRNISDRLQQSPVVEPVDPSPTRNIRIELKNLPSVSPETDSLQP